MTETGEFKYGYFILYKDHKTVENAITSIKNFGLFLDFLRGDISKIESVTIKNYDKNK